MLGRHKFKLKTCLWFATCVLLFNCLTSEAKNRYVSNNIIACSLTNIPDTIPLKRLDTVSKRQDSINARRDTVPTVDTFSLRMSKDTLSGPVKYIAEDSAVVLVQDKKILLYGKTVTEYNDVKLEAPQVVVDQQTNIMTATADRDSLGNLQTRARFEQGENRFQSDTIKFNFKTKRGLTRNTFTQQGEMYVQGDKIKKADSSTIFVSSGRLTTCNYDDPHFAFRTNRLKVINNKVAVTGPTHPEFEGVPLPIYLPFGFFPLSQGRHSGFLAPQIATNEQFGLGLEGLGYYKVLNQYVDLRVQGNIYSYGTWSTTFTPMYRKRYRYNGSMNLTFQRTKSNFKGDPDFNLAKTFMINWSHSVDQRARPGTTFSANVNAGSTRHNQLQPNNPIRNFTNQLNSSISYSKTWAGKPYNLSLSANHSQNNNTRLMNIILPTAGFTVNTIYPFQRKTVVGAKKWYENLGLGYNGNFSNQLSFYDTAKVRFADLIDTMQWGAQHRFPITMSLPPAGPFIFSPSISYQQVWLQNQFIRKWNPALKKVDTVINKGFFVDQEVSLGMSASTSVFGTLRFQRSRVAALRHVVRPQFSINYRPDLSGKNYYSVKLNEDSTNYGRFSKLAGNLFSPFSEGTFGGISFGVDNNLEMKWRSRKDTGENAIRKIRIIDGFGFNSGYNFLADSMQLQNFNLYLRSTLAEKINITASALLSPYQTDRFGRSINKYSWANGFNLGTLQYGSLAVSTQFQSKKKEEKKEDTPTDEDGPALRNGRPITDPMLLNDQQMLMDYMRQNPSEFVDFNINWQVSLSLSAGFTRRAKLDYSGFENEFNANLSFNGSFNLTPKWNFSSNGFYDFKTLKLQTFTMAISRDMHCWQMSINVTPVGPYRSFSFTINPKASLLQDLRVNRSRTFSNF